MRYKTVNNLIGWIAFAIAAFVYCSTIEPSDGLLHDHRTYCKLLGLPGVHFLGIQT